MDKPFTIRHADGREYELTSYAFFLETYEPLGFFIVDPQPTGYELPYDPGQPEAVEPFGVQDLDLDKLTRAELDALAKELGVDADGLPTKQAVKDAILEAQA